MRRGRYLGDGLTIAGEPRPVRSQDEIREALAERALAREIMGKPPETFSGDVQPVAMAIVGQEVELDYDQLTEQPEQLVAS